MDQLVALRVQVHALRSQVAGDEHPDRRRRLLEVVDDRLLIGVSQAAVQNDHLLRGHREVRLQVFLEPLQRADALGEDHHPGGALRADAELP